MEGTSAGAAAPESSAPPESSAAPVGSPPASPSKDSHGRVPGAIFSSLPVLDLSQNGLQHLGDVLKIPTLKQLHLQRNALRAIPPDFFQLLPCLTWLDLRHNRIEALPPGVGSHRYLKTLLLERNPIKMLPVELGNVRTLRALNLRCCPVEFPPQLVVQKGPAAILSFLRACAMEPAPRAISPPETMTPSQPPHPHGDVPKECAPDRETTRSQGPEGSRLVEAADPSELRRCPLPCEDWPTEGELRRFWKLRQEIVEKEQAEVLQSQLLAVELPPNLRAMLRGQEDVRPGPRHTLRRAAPSLRGALPDLASAYLAVSWAGQLEERRASALRELQEKQALLEQHRRDQRILREWREQAQAMKRKKEELGRLRPPRRTLVALEVPFATDLPDKARAPVNPPGQRAQSKERSLRASDTLRAGHQGALEERLRRHLRQVRERRAAFGGAVPLGAIRKAAEDLDVSASGRFQPGWTAWSRKVEANRPAGSVFGRKDVARNKTKTRTDPLGHIRKLSDWERSCGNGTLRYPRILGVELKTWQKKFSFKELRWVSLGVSQEAEQSRKESLCSGVVAAGPVSPRSLGSTGGATSGPGGGACLQTECPVSEGAACPKSLRRGARALAAWQAGLSLRSGGGLL